MWMNTVFIGVLLVEQLMNICGLGFIYIVIYIRFENYVYWFEQ